MLLSSLACVHLIPVGGVALSYEKMAQGLVNIFKALSKILIGYWSLKV